MSWAGPAETKMSWAGPAETPEGWFRLGTGNFPDTGRYPLSNTIPWCLGDPWGDGKRPRAETDGGWPRRATPSLRRACRIPPANSTKERFRRLRERTQAANSNAVKEDELFGSVVLSQ